MNVLDFQKMKDEGRKISMVTCYDYSSARAVAESSIDCILVGDSVAMTMHGFSNTLSATTPMMALHTAAAARVPRQQGLLHGHLLLQRDAAAVTRSQQLGLLILLLAFIVYVVVRVG